MFKYFFLCRVILILLPLQKRCLEVFINGVINFPYRLITIYTYTVSLTNKACHEEYSLVVHCKRETTQILFGTLYYGNFYEVLWTEILLFHFPGDYGIAGHMNFVKAIRGNFMINFFDRVLHMRLLCPEI